MKLLSLVSLSFLVLVASVQAEETVVVQEGEVSMSYGELEASVSTWTDQMRTAAVQDEGDRIELINLVFANKKIAHYADQYVEQHPDALWQYVREVEAAKRNFVLKHVRDSIETPDFTELAKERYQVERDRIALIPELRTSSHILFISPPGLPRDEVLAKAQTVLDELRSGADFVEMVKLHSGEPGAADRDGKFDRWLKYGDREVAPPYSDGLFAIEAVGEYSELVETQFGVHIIRLDGIKPKGYKPFGEVKGAIIKELEEEYVRLTMKDFVAQFQMGEDTVIDDAAVQQILNAYGNAPAAE